LNNSLDDVSAEKHWGMAKLVSCPPLR
jgi:hypothetical protein